jgi:hypothetical protein
VYYISIDVQTPNFYALSIQTECCKYCLCIGSWSEYYSSMVTDNQLFYSYSGTVVCFIKVNLVFLRGNF